MGEGRGNVNSYRKKGISVFMVLILLSAGFIMIVSLDGGNSIPSEGLVVHYAFDEASGQVLEDSSPNGWDAQLGESDGQDGNDPDWTDGMKNGSLLFDGVNDYAICNPFDFPISQFSMAFWIRIPDDDHDSWAVSYAVEEEDNEVLVGFRSNIHIEIDWDNTIDFGMDLRDGSWHHFAMTWQNSNGSIVVYIDGEEEFTGTLSVGVAVVQGGALVLGYEQDEVGGGFQDNQGLVGGMDEFVIYSSFLGSNDIASLYDSYDLQVQNLTATPGSGFIDLNWNEVDDPDLKQYNIYRVDPLYIHNGLRGEYYDEPDLTNKTIERFDDNINFYWGQTPPHPSISQESYSISWNGYLRIERRGNYDFYTLTEDGTRIWIDGRLLLDDWNDYGSIENTFSVELEEGYHPIRMDFLRTDSRDAQIKLDYDGPGAPRMVIPSEALFTFNRTEFTKIGSVSENNFRDSNLLTDEPYFYYVTYEKNDGTEGPVSEIIGSSPTFSTTLDIYPTTDEATVGATVEYTVIIRNDGRVADWFNLSVKGLESFDHEFSNNEIYLRSGWKTWETLTVIVPENAMEGLHEFQVCLSSDITNVSQEVDLWIDVSLDPVIDDLLPYDGFRSGSMNVLFSWRTDVDATTEVFLREEGSDDYERYEGNTSMDHSAFVYNLERYKDYEYYVVSTSSRGSTQSEVRSFEVTAGLVFADQFYGFSIERDYAQIREIRVYNHDEKVHRYHIEVNNPNDDLIVGFTGSGTSDIMGSIPPGASDTLEIAFYAQDAMSHRYDLLLNLSTLPDLGEEPMHAYSRVQVSLDHLFVNMTLSEISTDPYTLTKKIRITNDDDPVTDLRIYAVGEDRDRLNFEPSIEHGNLRTGESIEIEVSPEISFSFVSFTARIFVAAYDKVYTIDLEFKPPEGWESFAASIYPNWGGQPFLEIDPDDIDMDGLSNGEDDDIDGDGIPNIDEPDYAYDTDNDGKPNEKDTDDDGDGNPDSSDFWRIDFDNDYIPDYLDDDKDGDGIDNDEDEFPDDHDNDGKNNGKDKDDDDDRIKDKDDYHPQDHDNDGENDGTDSDDDNDGQEDSTDSNPYDQDNDGTPDSSDSDWKGGGPANPGSPSWNPNQSPGGSPGSWGGSGSSGSSEGNDWYCTNKPELDLLDLLIKLLKLGKLLVSMVRIFTAATPVGLITNFLFFLGEWGLKEAGKMAYNGLFGNQLRDDVAKYYPDFAKNTSRSPNAIIEEDIIHYYWQAEEDGHVQIKHFWIDPIYDRVGDVATITTSDADSKWPSMVSDDDGRLYMTWIDHKDGNGEVYFKSSSYGGTQWYQDVRVTNSMGDADDPEILIDEFGRFHLTWVDTVDGNEEIYHSYSDDGDTWTTPDRMSNSAGRSTRPVMKIDHNNDVHLVWAEESGASSGIQYVFSDDRGETWSSPDVISPEGDDAGEPTMDITPSGVVHVAWRDSREGDSEIYYRKSTDLGSSWEDEVRITDDESYSEYPELVCVGEDLYLSWHDDHTGMDLTYFKNYNESSDDWTLMKRVPAGQPRIDKIEIEIELHPHEDTRHKIKPHNVYLMLDDIVIGSIINQVPDGKYSFEIPLDIISPMATSLHDHEFKLKTTHLNPGHYAVMGSWKLSWYSFADHQFLFAPDQYSADEYLRKNVSVEWFTEDPAIYSNQLHISDNMPHEGDQVQILAAVSNPGGDVAENVEVRFYEMEPGNESRRIGDPIIIDHIGPYDFDIIQFDWTVTSDVSRIYAVVDPMDEINELDETNNQAYVRLTTIYDTPPEGKVILNEGSPFTGSDYIHISLETDSANEVTHVAFSNDNETWSDWMWISDHMSWKLDRGGTRSYAVGDGVRTVFAKFKDIAGLESEVYSETIEFFQEHPAVLDFSAEDGVIGPDENLMLEFSNPMDEIATISAVLITPSIDGSFIWENRTLIFKPQGEWTIGETYNISISTDATDFHGRHVEEIIFWTFTVTEAGDDDVDDDDQNETDTDNDGIPDWWEEKYGLNITDPNDAQEDMDNDGVSNIDEFQGDSDPTDPDDVPSDNEPSSEIGLYIAMVIVILFVLLLIIGIGMIVAKRSKGSEEDWED